MKIFGNLNNFNIIEAFITYFLQTIQKKCTINLIPYNLILQGRKSKVD